MDIKLKNLSLKFSNWQLQNFSLVFESGKITSIVGPSGCGKTTILRIISGLEKQDSGKIFFGEKDMSEIPVEERNTGFVFQNDSLFTHLNVFENVAFGLRVRKEKDILKKVKKALSLVYLNGFEKRNVTTLSGGEKKRVAIARVIAIGADILLLDEPLNGMDAKLKEKTKLFLKDLLKKTGITMIFVTHDIDEAFFLSDKIAVMQNGRLEQVGDPFEIFSKPKNAFVKDFVSDYMLIEGRQKKSGKKTFIEGKFSFSAKEGKGNPLINLKKSNYKYIED